MTDIDLDQVNDHDLFGHKETYYGGSSLSVWCGNEGCLLETRGEYGARERAVDRAEEHDCPYTDAPKCIFCGDPIRPDDADICQYCSITRGRRVRDLDEEGHNRNSNIRDALGGDENDG